MCENARICEIIDLKDAFHAVDVINSGLHFIYVIRDVFILGHSHAVERPHTGERGA